MKMLVLSSVLVALAGMSAQAGSPCVVESARQIPVITNVDVVVVGGSVAGVAAACAARQAGASVYLAAERPYLGVDMAGTLELGLPEGRKPSTDLVKKLWAATSDTVHYAYKFDRVQPKGPWIYRNDGFEKLCEPGRPPSPADVVLFESDVSVTCTLDESAPIGRIEALVMERRGVASEGVHVTLGAKTTDNSGRLTSATDTVKATALDGPAKGRVFELKRRDGIWKCHGDYYRGAADVVTFACDAGVPLHAVRLDFGKAAQSKNQLVTRIWFRRTDVKDVSATPSPLKVKRLLDAELVQSGVGFITGSPATDRLVDDMDRLAGVVVANRSGRQAIVAKTVIDATAYADLAGFARPLAGMPKTATFSRVIVSGEPPKGDGIRVEELPQRHGVSGARFSGKSQVVAGQGMTGRVFRCTLDLPLSDGGVRGFMSAEASARDRTWTTTTMDDANELVLRTRPRAPRAEVPGLYCIDAGAALEDRIRTGGKLGRAAAAQAAGMKAPSGVRVAAEAPKAGVAKGEVREELTGLRPYELGRARTTVPSPARDLPVLGEWDVVVVGAGSAGAPAAIAAGRAGARTLAIDFMYVLGGVSTEGMILGYYDGNHCGFTEEFKKNVARIDAEAQFYRRAETHRRWAAEAGVEVWYGSFGAGAYVEDGRVCGVVVVTPWGRGVVRARAVVDGTGNSDVAAAAGAETVFLGAQEIAVQSAGMAPQRLGRGGINSDFGFVNDPCAWDMWLFGLRARAGAPDAWDISQVADSRERRRILPDLIVQGWDVVSKRGFPDTIVQALSRQDSHGYLADPFCAFSEVTLPEGRGAFNVNVPLRTLLPKGLSGICVIGLGKGCARDVNPMARMQADLMNEGYAAGRAAAMAAKLDGEFRKIDVKELQRHLVALGNLRAEVLDWTPETDAELTDDQIAAHVASMTNNFQGSWVVMRYPERARPHLRAGFLRAKDAMDQKNLQIYAIALGMLGDRLGAGRLARLVDGRVRPMRLRKGGAYGGEGLEQIGLMLALGRTRDRKHALPALLGRLEGVDAKSPLKDVRAVTLGLEALADPEAAAALAGKLDEPGVAGHAVSDFRDLTPQGGYGLGPEMDLCLRELAYARALMACGDWHGRGRAVYEAYARDPRGVLAVHANAVLSKYANPDFRAR